jgi:hypothetical protein
MKKGKDTKLKFMYEWEKEGGILRWNRYEEFTEREKGRDEHSDRLVRSAGKVMLLLNRLSDIT